MGALARRRARRTRVHRQWDWVRSFVHFRASRRAGFKSSIASAQWSPAARVAPAVRLAGPNSPAVATSSRIALAESHAQRNGAGSSRAPSYSRFPRACATCRRGFAGQSICSRPSDRNAPRIIFLERERPRRRLPTGGRWPQKGCRNSPPASCCALTSWTRAWSKVCCAFNTSSVVRWPIDLGLLPHAPAERDFRRIHLRLRGAHNSERIPDCFPGRDHQRVAPRRVADRSGVLAGRGTFWTAGWSRIQPHPGRSGS